MKNLILISSILFISSCSPILTHNTGLSKYKYVGCYNVVNNPSADNSIAFGPFATYTSRIFFKQFNKDESISKINGTKC